MIKTGDKVGAHRWPGDGGKPWAGILLDKDDPRAWAKTIAFPTERPNREKVKAHVAKIIAQGLLSDVVPVLWDFGDCKRVWWETLKNLRPYADDLAEWEKSRQVA